MLFGFWGAPGSARCSARLTQIGFAPVGLSQLRMQGPLGARLSWLIFDKDFAPSLAQKT
jgi:hypothetical protein